MDYLDSGYRLVRIVITGGPCSGKSSALARTVRELEGEDYQILLMPETATSLISRGISPAVCQTFLGYQKIQMYFQMEKEKTYAMAAEEISRARKKDILIVYDRGMMDNKAYMTDEDFQRVMEDLGVSEEDCLTWYDAVFHLDTAAKGAREYYTSDNNRSRTETAEEAIQVDNNTLHAWDGHPNRMIIDNSTGFEEKMNRLFTGIRDALRDLEEGGDML